MKKILMVIAAVVAISFLVSCYVALRIQGSGRIITEQRHVSEFNRVDFRGPGKLYVSQGDTQRVAVTTDDNVMPYLQTDVRNGVLVVYIKPQVYYPQVYHPTVLEVQVDMVKVRGISLSGSGVIEGRNQIRSDSLDVNISGAGDAYLEIMAKHVATRLSGSGKMTLNLDCGTLTSKLSGSGKSLLSGESISHRYTVSGSGRLHGFDLITKETWATISGSGNCDIFVTDFLDVRISGSGSIRYKGNPKIESRISGSGSVRSVN